MKIKLLILGIFLSLSIQQTYAFEAAGKTMVARGDVIAISDSAERKLKRRAEVFQNDTVTTGDKSKAQLRMLDGGMISLKENSELVIAQYQTGEQDEKGSVVLSLVKGGLRSITGAIKEDKGDYKLNTPVASIGIRGTHYEIELIDGELFLAVWDGAIDIVLFEQGNSTFSLGQSEPFSYAKVNKAGVVSFLLAPPKNFEDGMSSEKGKAAKAVKERKTLLVNNHGEAKLVKPNEMINILEGDRIEDIFADRNNTFESQDLFTLASSKTGSLQYSEATTSASNISNFDLGLLIDFDTGAISDGQLSFNDDQSEDKWTAVFSGNMNLADEQVTMEVDITFAAHGDVKADGDISAGFVEGLGLDAVVGEFELYESRSDVSVGGNYRVGKVSEQ